MFRSDSILPLHILILTNIVIRYFCSKIFCLEENRREKVSKRAIFMDSEFFLHRLSIITSKEDSISFAPDTSHPHAIHSSLECKSCELLFCLSQFFSHMNPLIIEELLFYELLFSSLHSKIRLSKGYLLFSCIAILRYEVCSISSEMKIRTRSSSITFYRSR